MYHEVWRIERDFFYDPHVHGLDLAAAEKFYAPFLENIQPRGPELPFHRNARQHEVGHTYSWAAANAGSEASTGGAAGRRLRRLKTAATESPRSTAAKTGTRSSARRSPARRQRQSRESTCWRSTGRELRGADNVYSFFQETAGKQTVLRVGPRPGRQGRARGHRRCPSPSETALRNLDWIEGNRRKVDQAERRQGGLRLPARHRRRRLHQLQPLLTSPRWSKQAR